MTIHLQNITKSYTQDIILDDLTMKITDGEHIAIVGENGCGKSTLLKVIAGLENIQEGERIVSKHTKIAYLNQNFDEFSGTVEAYLMQTYSDIMHLKKKMKALEKAMEKVDEVELEHLLKKYGNIQERFEQLDGYHIFTFVDQIAHGLQFSSLLYSEYEVLSGGEKARVNLARRLLERPDVLLLDEPTNHLDFKGIAWLENFLANDKQTIIVVSHDRTFLNHCVSKIYEISYGELSVYHGNYDVYRKEKNERFLRMQEDYEAQQNEIKRLEAAIRQFRQWGREGDNEKFFKKAIMLEKRLDKIERMRRPRLIQRNMDFTLSMAKRSSKHVLEIKELGHCFDKLLFEHVNATLCFKERVAICGENGTGKSTLIKLIMGVEEIQEGSIQYGNHIAIGYLPQMISFPKDMTILEYAKKELCMNEEDTRRYLMKYGFDHIDMMKRLKALSGGEKTRLKLAEMLSKEINMIILDEPTNHLDFTSIDIIEENLQAFAGTLLVVSHDRYFIQALCEKVWMLEDQTMKEYIL
ncbi:ribosomal protection-like ABC-F family protein [Amedibacillus hominis]|uniref:ATP-binding cassette domain-containing protein n=1 Tax=Amedibacillus hominis TaxID=2897776 RepID=A0ABS9R4X8_9FIRM|nr:ABC-F family ATP-binding cassette domain-containing protein [Amedibacillus hominis]MCH4284687.1 ATP-binding cassette domain-containing protein [Amedibacillus hominis]